MILLAAAAWQCVAVNGLWERWEAREAGGRQEASWEPSSTNNFKLAAWNVEEHQPATVLFLVFLF